ncbi:hypothetical protein E2986_03757 [Frieseomelitta varia]|uniref:Coiled-coil domain-containing protein 134 n=1 Tax=Frieseomelitta varia TaxID=561572 RepID=A0A833SB68_9HYME|nr:hypothetical protein E2986_03757 [Frieseomelitta varia]
MLLVKKSFEHQRKEHTEAIKRLQKIDSYERLYKMIIVLGEKMIDVIETSKSLIESGGFNPDNRSLPQNVTVQSGNSSSYKSYILFQAISTTLENTAFFGDILLHFPHIVHRVLKTQQKWNPIINWSFNFTYRAKYLLDSETVTKIHLASQELNIIKREEGYFNPYWQPTESQRRDNEKTTKKNSAKKEKQKRKPQMVKIEF